MIRASIHSPDGTSSRLLQLTLDKPDQARVPQSRHQPASIRARFVLADARYGYRRAGDGMKWARELL